MQNTDDDAPTGVFHLSKVTAVKPLEHFERGSYRRVLCVFLPTRTCSLFRCLAHANFHLVAHVRYGGVWRKGTADKIQRLLGIGSSLIVWV